MACKQPSRLFSTISLRPSTTDKMNCKFKDWEHQQPNQQIHRMLHYCSQQTASCNSIATLPIISTAASKPAEEQSLGIKNTSTCYSLLSHSSYTNTRQQLTSRAT
ncbi:hypothetical protein Nepgr_031316 [Nepenthes gracilis]|uniref:Uncharacterized protein n=1 Tax=Nepenthes gracilis TaxID=150966 RepID=A0AAD3Y519_NEPGR|nr:hypothetical protein Nepgr_031316 [Nepenthes gracilis]